MALKPCRECKKEISTDVNACPHCGKKKPHASKVRDVMAMVGITFGMCFLLTLIIGVVKSGEKPDASAVTPKPRQKIVPKYGPPTVEVLVPEMWRDYQSNEVAADEKYKGKRIAVTGIISSITKNAFGMIVVRLLAPGQNSVVANFGDDQTKKVAAAKVMHEASLICTGNMMILGNIQLEDCVFKEQADGGQK